MTAGATTTAAFSAVFSCLARRAAPCGGGRRVAATSTTTAAAAAASAASAAWPAAARCWGSGRVTARRGVAGRPTTAGTPVMGPPPPAAAGASAAAPAGSAVATDMTSTGGGAAAASAPPPATPTITSLAVDILRTAAPLEKARLATALFRAVDAPPAGTPPLSVGDTPPPDTPARPAAPPIVAHPPSARESGVSAEVFYLHSLAHVELNAIDLALDTLARFAATTSPPPPRAFVTDFVRIAADESRHFCWLSARLAALGATYGDLPAHGLVWASADATRSDLAARLALGQLVQEARGLDAGPRLADRLVGGGAAESAALVLKISSEEVPHVAAGVRWFVWAVSAGVGAGAASPQARFFDLAMRHANAGALAPPFNKAARDEAGLGEDWYLPAQRAARAAAAEAKRAEAAEVPSCAE
ncbi:hypothetical protein I4F81_011926 [Pyropia yezoensis]|uniref:Uncharacterized protein n=1 Tax=Pyropia yezoensis TaxID=2788 RepID=A0ACC3CHM9_PYRYE|nr:hypothetical protein I4F81_011926 [Neopyropia yezoensis]